MTGTYDLTKVHEANLKILKEIDRICRKYKIKYLMDAGTLLGAVRHQGFIPWDDDADVAFTRNHYDAFMKVVRRELPDTMEIVEPGEYHGGEGFYDFTARIIYKNSQNHKNTPEMQYYDGKLNHLWVDLFTIDKLPQNKIRQTWTLLINKAIYGMAMGHRYHIDYSGYSLAHKIFVRVLATAGKVIPLRFLIILQKKAALMDRKKKSNLRYYSNYQPDYLYVTLQSEWCEETVELDFCDTKLMAPKGWHEVLTWVYGDYKKLPPEDKRIPSHSSMEIKIFD